MRIAIITPGFSKDAGDWAIPAIQSLVLEQAKLHDVTVFSLRYPPAGQYDVAGVNHLATGGGERFGLSSLDIILRTVRAIVGQHRQRAFDIVHAFWADEPGLTAVIAGAWLRLPAVVSLSGGELTHLPDIDYGTQLSTIRGWLTLFVLQRAAILTAGSHYQQQLAIEKGASPTKLRLLPLGVDAKRFTPAESPSAGRPTIIQAASLVPVKNQALLLELLDRIRGHIPDVRLRLVGSGPLEKNLRHLAAQANLENHVAWQEAVPYPAMPDQYRLAQLYLQTSRHESQGMAVLEAMACGLPVIGTPVGVLPELSARPATADPDLLTSYVVEMLSQPEGRRRWRTQARDRVMAGYELTRTAGAFADLYEAVRRSTLKP